MPLPQVQSLSATDARTWALRSAHWLARAGLSSGDRVAIITPEHRFPKPEAALIQSQVIAISLGCLQSGLVPVMINPLLTDAERGQIIADCRPRRLLQDANDFAELLAPIGESAAPDLSEAPLGRPMHYTSGTTGAPKGVWTHDLAEAEAALLWAEEREQWEFEASDRYLLHGPLCHSAPLRFAHATLLAGGSVLTQGWFDALETSQAIHDLSPTVAFAVPTQLQRILQLPQPPTASFRLLAHAGAACPAKLKTAIHEWASPEVVWEFYGSTEGQITACSAQEWADRPGTVGRARPHRHLQIVDEAIWCAAPHYARFNYWRDEPKTARALRTTPTGIQFTVGDLGRLDDDGYLFLEGRREDLIITGGVNVYPTEVEGTLNRAPGVDQAAVFGIPSTEWGHEVTAAFIGDADPQDIAQFARGNLAAHKRPKAFHRVDELPFTTSGKLHRLKLADSFTPREKPRD